MLEDTASKGFQAPEALTSLSGGARGSHVRTISLVTTVLILVLAYGYGAVASNYTVNEATLVVLAILGASGLNLITGYSGQASVGNGGFLAIGAVTGYICGRASFPYLGSIVLATIAGLIIGGLVGVVSLRWRNFYLVIATLAFQSIVVFAMTQYQNTHADTLAGYAMPQASVFGFAITGNRRWYFVTLTIAVLATLMIWNLTRGRWGRGWKAIRANEEAASAAGIQVLRYKVMAVAIGSALMSLQGVLQAYFIGTVSGTDFTIPLSVSYVAMIIIGGAGTVIGPVIGAIVVTEVPYIISLITGAGSGNLPYWQTIAYALLVVVFLFAEPGGIVKIFARAWAAAYRRMNRSPYASSQSNSDGGAPASGARGVSQ